MKKMYIIAFLLLLFYCGFSQDTIILKNPSFEDEPGHSKVPKGWEDNGFEGESPPDVQPSGEFGVTKGAAHGKTYLAMVLRDNDTWECVGQPLSQPLRKDSCYQLSLKACRSEIFTSISRISNQKADYINPAVLRVWGGYTDEEKEGFEILAETEAIANTDWREYSLSFVPGEPYDYFYLEAYFDQERHHPYNGNVLVDQLSNIVPCSLAEEEK